mmetsp:Transcript_4694/g.3950  ORF Transcript_4694/g.3950 Transcript_4694/m.3950 type:complete len:204 (+) Transcript_4694:653-1264(+)
MSYKGVAIATTITQTLNFVIAYGWISYDNSIVKPNSWNYINSDSFTNLIGYLKYGAPAYVMLAFEIWGFEALSIMSGYVGVYELGASIIVINIVGFFYMIPLGISFIASSLVGNNLGANKPRVAKVYTNVSLLLVFVLSLVIGLLLLIYRVQVAYIFTDDERIQDLIISTMPAVFALYAGDYMQCITAGIIRGMGYQKYGTPT